MVIIYNSYVSPVSHLSAKGITACPTCSVGGVQTELMSFLCFNEITRCNFTVDWPSRTWLELANTWASTDVSG